MARHAPGALRRVGRDALRWNLPASSAGVQRDGPLSRAKKTDAARRARHRRRTLLLSLGGSHGLHGVLARGVEAAGGRGGLKANWDAEHPERGPSPSSYNLDESMTQALSELLAEAPALDGRPLDHALLARV